MQIVIPMSGFGERFRRAGFDTPKPLIVVDGKTIIHHVVDLFPGDHDFIFVCNEEHLENPTFRMRKILGEIGVSHKIHPVAPHKLGPVHSILSARELINPDAKTIVNYADLNLLWDFQDFSDVVSDPNFDGAVPAFRGFHPHNGGTTTYAYIRERNNVLEEIREKQSFTEDGSSEFASTGTYYFKNARLMLHYLERQLAENLSVGGEFYVSSAFDLMAQDKKTSLVYEVSHFMQWGTPEDLAQYELWSERISLLSQLGQGSLPIEGVGTSLLLASGLGSRFTSQGYETPKPLLKVGGQTILEQVRKASDLDSYCLVSSLESSGVGSFTPLKKFSESVVLSELSEGQAESAALLLKQASTDFQGPLTIFPTDTLFADQTRALPVECASSNYDILTVWTHTPTYFNWRNPESFGWIGTGPGDEVWSTVKAAPPNAECLVMSGAFTFSSSDFFRRLYKLLGPDRTPANGEKYLDSLVEIAKGIGAKVTTFSPSLTISLGTPYEFESFRYWQSCFDRWVSHPYSLSTDIFVLEENVTAAREELSNTLHRPGEWLA